MNGANFGRAWSAKALNISKREAAEMLAKHVGSI